MYLKYAETNLRSTDTATRNANRFLKLWGNRQLNDITPQEIEKYKLMRSNTVIQTKLVDGEEITKYVSAATINRELGVLSKIFSIAVKNGYVRENPVKHVNKLLVKNKIERHLTPEEEIRMLKVCENDFSFLKKSQKEQQELSKKYFDRYSYLKSILILALNTGLRKSEILNLTWDCIDFNTNELTVLDTKNGKKNVIPMSAKLRSVLSEKYRAESMNKYVFTNPLTNDKYVDIKKAFKSLCGLANVDKLRFHDLRHTAATRMVDCGVPLPAVKEILNHSSINTTMRYAHTMRKQKETAVEALSSYAF